MLCVPNNRTNGLYSQVIEGIKMAHLLIGIKIIVAQPIQLCLQDILRKVINQWFFDAKGGLLNIRNKIHFMLANEEHFSLFIYARNWQLLKLLG